MRLLGAVLAGLQHGGGDVVALDRVAAALAGQCAGIVAVGRHGTTLPFVPDRPATGLGPIGGLAGALTAAAEGGFDAVLTAGLDDMPPATLAETLALPNAIAAGRPLWGLWHAGLARPLADYLTAGGQRSIEAWVFATQAREVRV